MLKIFIATIAVTFSVISNSNALTAGFVSKLESGDVITKNLQDPNAFHTDIMPDYSRYISFNIPVEPVETWGMTSRNEDLGVTAIVDWAKDINTSGLHAKKVDFKGEAQSLHEAVKINLSAY
jgi:hypothetical protein